MHLGNFLDEGGDDQDEGGDDNGGRFGETGAKVNADNPGDDDDDGRDVQPKAQIVEAPSGGHVADEGRGPTDGQPVDGGRVGGGGNVGAARNAGNVRVGGGGSASDRAVIWIRGGQAHSARSC